MCLAPAIYVSAQSHCKRSSIAKSARGTRESRAPLQPPSNDVLRLEHAQTGTAPVAVVDAYRFLLPVQVDVAAQRERLGKEVMRQKAEIAKAHSGLATPSFVQHTPAAIVAQVRGWLAQFAASLTKVQEQVARLAPT